MNAQPDHENSADSIVEVAETISPRAVFLCIAGVLIPGLGHAVLRKWDRAVVFFFSIVCLFSLGLYLQGELFSPAADTIFSMLKFIADAGSGLIYWIFWLSGYGSGDPTVYTYDYANVFLYVAGLLNMLVVIDVFDIAMGRKQ
ncbi:MAG: hypothetical protein P8Z37_04540 [Acidobacteriota bacterium]